MHEHDNEVLSLLTQPHVVVLRQTDGTLATEGPDEEHVGLLLFTDMATAQRFRKKELGKVRKQWRPCYVLRSQLVDMLPDFGNTVCLYRGGGRAAIVDVSLYVESVLGQPYDVVMIRDFLQHLEWHLVCSEQELRQTASSHQELVDGQSDTRKINPELTEQLGKYIDRRRRVLLFGRCIDRQDCTNEEVAKALGEFATIWAEKRSKQLGALRSLRTCFQEALKAAEIELDPTKGVPLIPFTARDLFEDDGSSQ